MALLTPLQFQKTVLTWFDQHGRKQLPWQTNKTPYRVWVSEIMLQQTQVATVIAYYRRFMKRFPSVKKLSEAPVDEVLALWTGLGYYARARNLHCCAQIVSKEYRGRFPETLAGLMALPGIGRSTAGAILSIAFNQSAPILDGNVKRVLQRLYGITQWYGNPETLHQLWQLAETLTPTKRTADYAQAMMDLGAMVCTRSKPSCLICPLQKPCVAFQQQLTHSIPAKKPQKAKPIKHKVMLMLENANGDLFLEKRPSKGIWGGLWSFLEFDSIDSATQFCQHTFKKAIQSQETWQTFRHTFTHYHLNITPLSIKLRTTPKITREQTVWIDPAEACANLGLCAPVKKLLIQCTQEIA